MTEKRFTYDSKTVSILKDGEFWLDGNIDTACNHSEICNELNNLVDENEQLKKQREELFIRERDTKNELRELKHKHSLLHDECLDAECDRDSYQKDVSSLEKENEDLKKLLEAYRKSVEDYKYQICKAVDEKLSMIELADNCGIDVE